MKEGISLLSLTNVHEKLIHHELKLATKSETFSTVPVTANVEEIKATSLVIIEDPTTVVPTTIGTIVGSIPTIKTTHHGRVRENAKSAVFTATVLVCVLRFSLMESMAT